MYQAGTLYYTSANANSLVALPTDGSAPTVLASVSTTELWIEGTNLLFAQGNLDNQIYVLPLTGGTPQLLLDGGAGRTNPGYAAAHAFNATDFYWTEVDQSNPEGPTTVWHQSRSGGTANQIGTATFVVGGQVFTADAVALTANAVVAGSVDGVADAFPFDASAPLPLAVPPATVWSNAAVAELSGVDSLGAYWSIPGAGPGPSALVLSPADGAPATALWPSFPFATANVDKVWSNPEGGWVVSAWQEFDDGRPHTTLTLIDAQGTATRLGCSPGESQSALIRNPVAVAPDAVYAVAMNLDASTWEIDRIAR